jgi:cobalt/nickel transport system permease protein
MDFATAISGGSEDSLIHRLDPRAKIVAAAALVAIAVSTPPRHLAAFAAYGGILLWIAAIARVSVLRGLLRAACVLPFSILAAFWLPFHVGGNAVRVLGLFSVSADGLWLLAAVVMKSFLGASAALLLIATTSFGQLAQGLRGLGSPVIFVDLLGLSYRYIFVLAEEAWRMQRAVVLRGYRPRWLPQAVIVGRMIGGLFLRSYDRAERVFGAMVLRGYSGIMPVPRPLRLRFHDVLAAGAMLTAAGAARMLL